MNTDYAAIVKRYFDAVWGAGDLASQADLLAPSYTGYWLIAGMPVRSGLAAHQAWLENVRAGMPDLRYTIEDMIIGDDKAVARVALAGTNTGPIAGRAPTGRRATVQQIFVFHFAGGQIQQEWVSFDRSSFMQQLEG